jgi:Zn-dependent metalloprotease
VGRGSKLLVTTLSVHCQPPGPLREPIVPRWILLLLIAGLSAGVNAEAGAQVREGEHERPARQVYEPLHLEREVRDAASGVVRARYRIEDVRESARADVSARRYLEWNRSDFGILDVEQELRLVRTRTNGRITHLTFEQLVDGIPVLGRSVHVNADSDGHPTMVISGFEPIARSARSQRVQLHSAGVIQAAERAAGHRLTVVAQPRLVIHVSDGPRKAYHLVVRPPDDRTEWSFVIDASTGDVLEWVSTATHSHPFQASCGQTFHRNSSAAESTARCA